jgi:histone H2B
LFGRARSQAKIAMPSRQSSEEPEASVPVHQVQKNSKNSKRQRSKKKSNREHFSKQIYNVLKQVHPDARISRQAMSIVNSFVNDCFERITKEAANLAEISKTSTLRASDIQSSVKLILPGELCKHAISE